MMTPCTPRGTLPEAALEITTLTCLTLLTFTAQRPCDARRRYQELVGACCQVSNGLACGRHATAEAVNRPQRRRYQAQDDAPPVEDLAGHHVMRAGLALVDVRAGAVEPVAELPPLRRVDV